MQGAQEPQRTQGTCMASHHRREGPVMGSSGRNVSRPHTLSAIKAPSAGVELKIDAELLSVAPHTPQPGLGLILQGLDQP